MSLIKSATIITMDDKVGTIQGSVLVEDGVIKEVIPHYPESEPPIRNSQATGGKISVKPCKKEEDV
ncbi:hypothetical protein [Peribacillus sp. TH14]|uniref:hypothetical protein n=1 Tax=Peribacillus sp. TH14 TaxID=2798481 RepID=UPI0019124041|nr:hypothetical protein [Peribacillus sp. TH14]MBK5502223.1 hypothetical protein [Peribacillus sp. TH14]